MLVKWKGESAALSIWEDVDTFCAKHPTLQLEDELNLDGGRCHVGTRLYASDADTGCASRTRAQSAVPGMSRAGQGTMPSAVGANRKWLNLGRIFLVSIYCYLFLDLRGFVTPVSWGYGLIFL